MTLSPPRPGADFARYGKLDVLHKGPDLRDACVVVLGHGSREQGANADHEALARAWGARHPGARIVHAFVELARPSLEEGLDQAARASDRVVVAPLMLFAAGHVKNDVPLAVALARKRHPHVRFTAAPALGVHPALAQIVFERARDALGGAADLEKTALIVVGRGSSDPDANGDLCKLARIAGEGRGFARVEPSFIGITRPLFAEAMEYVVRAARPARIVIVPYMLFAGTLVDRLRVQARELASAWSWIRMDVADPIGADDRVLDLLDERVRGALAGDADLACDACQYRAPVGGIADRVGGLRALLWSVRHMLTHSQATPHRHAHKPLSKHVLVCTNADCTARGSAGLVDTLRRLVKRAGRQRDIKVTRTSCMGRCGEGPTVAVYPDGVWYRGVRESDAHDLVSEHLLCDRIVERLVDDIMQ